MSALPPIAEVLPHAAPMILLDEVLEYGPGRILCGVRLRADSPFVADGRAAAVVTLEYMAQAVAAYAGMKGRAAGEPPHIGFLLGARELSLSVPHLQVGDLLRVDVEHVFGDEQLGSFSCSVTRDGQRIARALLFVYLHDGTGPLPT
jgi:predicted hotdog family 3-hydroxylacyl-ACP dehydratase